MVQREFLLPSVRKKCMLLVSTIYLSPFYKCINCKFADAFIPASSLQVLDASIHASGSS